MREPQRRRLVGSVVMSALLFAISFSVEAQQAKKVYRIGYLSLGGNPTRESARAEAIRLALGELSYVEGQNIAIEYRHGDGKRDRAPALAAELVRLNVDIILVAAGLGATKAVKNATKTIPIVITGEGIDPVKAQAWLKALPVPAATSRVLRTFLEN